MSMTVQMSKQKQKRRVIFIPFDHVDYYNECVHLQNGEPKNGGEKWRILQLKMENSPIEMENSPFFLSILVLSNS